MRIDHGLKLEGDKLIITLPLEDGKKPSEVVVNGKIYAPHEKAQLSEENATKDATSDLIRRKKAIEDLQNGDPSELYEIEDIKYWINSLPSAEQEIIRCKDCKYQVKEWREDKRFKDNGYWVYGCKVISDICGYWAWFGPDDEFCSAAERRGEEE